jgi:hypothetical protein
MNNASRRRLSIALAMAAAVGCLFASDQFSPGRTYSWVSQAQAIIGRPMTPMSYAGVARRTVRRGYYY